MVKQPFLVDESRFRELFEDVLGAAWFRALVVFRNSGAPSYVASTLYQALLKGNLKTVLTRMEDTFGISRPSFEQAKDGFSRIWNQCGLRPRSIAA